MGGVALLWSEAGEWLRQVHHPRQDIHFMGRPTGVGQQNPCLRLCHGPDVLSEHLIGLYFDATAPDAQPERRGSDGKWSRSVALPRGMPPPVMSQEALVLAFCKLFPAS